MLYVRASVRAAFAEFQEDPFNRFDHGVRRLRAAQIRKLLADPDQVDLPTFNHEVWRFGPAFTFDGISTNLDDLRRHNPPEAWMSALRRALEDGQLALHGNYMWNSGTQRFDAQRPDDPTMLDLLRQALTLLNDVALKPHEKARQIDDVYGFGRNNATGLVMLFHPDEFAIENKRTEEAVRRLGYSGGSFQEIARELKVQLGALDFLELDIFLDYIYLDAIPLDVASETHTVEQFIETQAGRWVSRQGFRTDPVARSVIEAHAMQRAIAYYQAQGWAVEDVSKRRPYDLHCTRDSGELRVEVKGTTSDGVQVLLTRNEVQHAREHAPQVALFILASITLTAAAANAVPEASGGEPIILDPWQVDEAALTALAYTYAVPARASRRMP